MSESVESVPDLHFALSDGCCSEDGISVFRKEIWSFYAAYGRPFPWRETIDPYHIFVSEIMLQQTQTHRVASKYESFVARFPSFRSLANAPLRDVLILWQGLGYNRRARFLHESAQIVTDTYRGELPVTVQELEKLPGIGSATAASIAAFAFQQPTVFVETNIRAVFIAIFFQGYTNVSDKQLLPLIAQMVDSVNPRHWYYALMDYGVMLKKWFNNPSRQSKHHIQQSRFEGSERQVRGMILRYLTRNERVTESGLCKAINRSAKRVENNLSALCKEGLVQKKGEFYFL